MVKNRDAKAWDLNADFWDQSMGDDLNVYHHQVVRPRVLELLRPDEEDLVLDIGCGNGGFSAFLAGLGVSVVAFDYSSKMISLAQKRFPGCQNQLRFVVADATQEKEVLSLGKYGVFTKAVSTMAVMDIAELEPLFRALSVLLKENGIFVFATQHPCFVTKTDKYVTSHDYEGMALEGQPVKHRYYHRSLQTLFQYCFSSGFVVDGFFEECYDNQEIPSVIILRARKSS